MSPHTGRRGEAQVPGLRSYIVARAAQTGIEIRKISNLDATYTHTKKHDLCTHTCVLFGCTLCHSHVSSFPQTRVYVREERERESERDLATVEMCVVESPF